MIEPQYVKIWLPGEAPWGEVLEHGDGTIKVRISNKVAGDYSAEEWQRMLDGLFDMDRKWDGTDRRLHTFKQGDEIWVSEVDGVLQPMSRN